MKPDKKPAEKPKIGRGDRPTDAVIDGRTAEMVAVLSTRPHVQRVQLHVQFCERWRCHWRTVDRIVARARKEIFDRLGRSKEQFRCESLAFYEAMTADPKASVAEKTKARQRIDDLLGLDAPKRSELSGPDGGPLDVVPVASGTVVVYLPEKKPLDKNLEAGKMQR
jgi:hypothetical protein